MKSLFFILILSVPCLFSCENKFSVDPRQEESFIKIYGGVYKNQAVDLIYHESTGDIFMLVVKAVGGIVGGIDPPNDIMIIKTSSDGNNVQYFSTDRSNVNEVPTSMILVGDTIYITGGIVNANFSTLMMSKFSLISNTFNTTDFPNAGNVMGLDLTSDNNKIWICGDSISQQPSKLFIASYTIGQDESFNRESLLDQGVVKKIKYYNNVLYFLVQTRIETRDNIQLQSTAGFGGFRKTSPLPGNAIPASFMIDEDNNELAAVGYYANNDERLPQGTFLTTVRLENSTGQIVQATQEIINENNNEDTILKNLTDFIPVQLIKTQSNEYLIFGTSNERYIRLIKLNEKYELVWDKYYGSGRTGDKAGEIIQNANEELYFGATVNYQIGSSYSKVALFKTNSEGQLNF